MCRNIKTLRRLEQPPTEEDLRLAALQYVRKVSGYHKPSRLNQAVFDQTIEEIAAATQKLLDNLVARSPAPVSATTVGTAVGLLLSTKSSLGGNHERKCV